MAVPAALITSRSKPKSTEKVASEAEAARERALLLQQKTITFLGRVNPKTEREFFRILVHRSWDIRDELTPCDPKARRDYLSSLTSRIEKVARELADLSPDDLLIALADIDNRIWSFRVASAGNDVDLVTKLLMSLTRRSRILWSKLPRGDPDQLVFPLVKT